MKHFYTLIITIFLLVTNVILPGVLAGTLIKTSHGLVPIEQIAVGDYVTGCANNEVVNRCVTHIRTARINKAFVISTNKGVLYAVEDQLFYDPVADTWIKAENITTNTMLLDSHFNHCVCVDNEFVTIASTTIYYISTESPHNFFVFEHELLTHNFVPVIIIGLGWFFGGGIEFAGVAIAAVFGATAIGVKLFEKHGKDKFEITIEDCNSGMSGGFNKDPDDDDKSKKENKERKCNTITKTDFFRKVKNEYEHWRNGVYKRKGGAKGIEGAEYLEWDHLHNDVEVYGMDRWHMGSLDPNTLKLYKRFVKMRRIPK